MQTAGAREPSAVLSYVAERTGTLLSRPQAQRLSEAVRERLGGRTEQEYLAHLKSERGASELAELMSVVAVHKTDLFRDEVQLGAFFEHVLLPLARTGRPLKLWSAGCATGEEVATLLVLLEEAGTHPRSTVLGTDLSSQALQKAMQLSFGAEAMRRVPERLKAKYFAERDGAFELVPSLRSRATFVRHNLMDVPYPMPHDGQGYDVVFCRNVLIYFAEAAFDWVVAALSDCLAEGGVLVLSAAEPILRPQSHLKPVRFGESFFYLRSRKDEAQPRRSAPVPAMRATSPIEPPVAGLKASPEPLPPEPDPKDEAVQLFHLVLEWAAAGASDAETEKGLRRCLYLDPHFAQARYLLGMLLEQRGVMADAAAEYRRALAALKEGRSQAPPFFLNNERLKTACTMALERIGYR